MSGLSNLEVKKEQAVFQTTEKQKENFPLNQKTMLPPEENTKIVIREKTAFEKAMESYEVPEELLSVKKLESRILEMPRETEKQKEKYEKKAKKSLTAKKSCTKRYIRRLEKLEGSRLEHLEREYLYLLTDLSYRIDKEAAGLMDEKSTQKIQKLLERIEEHPCRKNHEKLVPAYMKEELSAGKETNLNALMDKYFPKGVKKENVNFGNEIQSLFRELGGSIHEENEKSGKDEIWSRIRTLGNKDSDSYRHLRAAVLRVKRLGERMDSSNMENIPKPEELMDAMARLSETANVYYDLHRGYQGSKKRKDRRKACDMIRSLTKEFFHRLDVATGGNGITSIAKKQEVDGTFDVKEGLKAKEKMEELASIYGKWKTHFSKQEGFERTKIRDRARLFLPYKRYIEIYKASTRIKNWPKEIEEVIRAAELYRVENDVLTRYEEQTNSYADPLERLAKKHANKMDGREHPEKELSEKEVDAALTPLQLKALDEVDQWFVRNFNNAGLVGSLIDVRNHHGEIVSELLSKTKRERLFIYYLIENRHRKEPNIFDVYGSQGYIPNLNRFKEQMLATKFKPMSHIMGDYTYMFKLTEAMQINRDYKPLIKDCATQKLHEDPLSEEEAKELKQEDAVKYRSYLLGQTFQATEAFREDALRVKGLGKKATKADEEALDKKRQAFLKSIEELVQADEAVEETDQYGEIGKEGEKKSDKVYNVKNNNLQEVRDNTNTYISAMAGIEENAHLAVNPVIGMGNLVRKGVSFVKGTEYKPEKWRLKGIPLMNAKLYSGAITASAISGLGSILSMCYGLYDLTVNWDKVHGWDRALKVTDIVHSAAKLAATTATALDTGKQLKNATEEITVTSSKTVKALGAVVSGIDTAKNLYTTISGSLDEKNADRANMFLKERIKVKFIKRLQNPDDEQESKEFRKARFEKNMLKVSKDISEHKKTYAGTNTIASSMQFAGAFVPGIGTIVSGAGTVMSLVTGLLGSMSLTKIREKMFDTYFDMEGFLKDAEKEMADQGRNIYNKEEFKLRMRRVLAASVGFSDLVSACDQISKRYADQIIAGLFGPKEERVQGDERVAYIELIKSFGLPYDKEKKIPPADLLARKMNGK